MGQTNKIFDREKVSFNTAKLKKGGEVFEIVINSDNAIAFRQGKDIPMEDILVNEHVFSDPQKGLKASEAAMKELFGTSDPLEVARIILTEGEIQLTADYRQKLRDEKKQRIISFIQVNSVDPRTKLPHPAARIESAFEEAKIHLDEFQPGEKQLDEVIKKLKVILPLTFEVDELQVTIPAQYAGKSYGTLKGFGTIQKEEWLSNGSFRCIIEMPAGLRQDFIDKLNSITHGDAEITIIKTK